MTAYVHLHKFVLSDKKTEHEIVMSSFWYLTSKKLVLVKLSFSNSNNKLYICTSLLIS